MVVEKNVCKRRERKGQKINHGYIEILKLEEVDIPIYHFKLTKKGTLRSKTIEIIKRLLPQPEVARWESVKPSRRSRRNMTSEIMGIDVDSDVDVYVTSESILLYILYYCNPMFIPGCFYYVFESCGHAPMFRSGGLYVNKSYQVIG